MRHSRSALLSGAIFTISALAAACSPAQAVLISSLSAFPAPEATVNFNQFSGSFISTMGPIQVGTSSANAVTLTANQNTVLGAANFGVGLNGMWDQNKTGFVGLDGQFGSITFTFDNGPVRAVGAFLNYSPNVVDHSMILEALSSTGDVIEAYDLRTNAPISTRDGVNAGAFRGIVRDTADIAAFRVSNSFVVIDDLQFARAVTSAAAPEPAPLGMIIFGLLPPAITLRRRLRNR